MRIHRIDLLLKRFVLLGILATSCGSVWASSSSCTYLKSATEIDGSGTGGTGMGGTGIVAKGTGIGGTGIRPEVGISEMQLAGNVIESQGTVEAQSNGRSRLLAKGDPVCVGETIMTSQSGTVQIKMADDGLIAVRPQTQLKIEKFVYSGTDKDSSLITLLKGSSRFVTGKLGKLYPQNDLIRTVTATIGVRGTDHQATVILPGDSRGYPSGTYDKVNQGITFIRTEMGEIDIHPNQVGFAVNTAEMPILLKDIPDFYNTNPSIKEGDSSSEEGKKEEGLSVDKKEGQFPEQSGKGSEFSHPPETGTTPSELPSNPFDTGIPESPALPELPESPAIPELPERSDY
jgi:hypothetical protein